MVWYKLKTWYGGEDALVKEIRRTVPPYLYEDVFVIRNERNLRRQRQNIIEQEPLFPGCVFLTCRETEPLLRRLEKVPAVSRLIACGYLSMVPLMEKDAQFLEMISGPDHVVRASYVLRESEEGTIYRVYGPLEYLLDGLEKIRFSARFAKTRRKLWGEDLVLPLGILANEDVGGSLLRRGEETVAEPPAAARYTLLAIDKDETGKNVYRTGSTVTILPAADLAAGEEKPAATAVEAAADAPESVKAHPAVSAAARHKKTTAEPKGEGKAAAAV